MEETVRTLQEDLPLEGEHGDYVRWGERLARLLCRQVTKKSFRSYVLANPEASLVDSMPVLFRLV
jgi:hypothetical protein